MKKLREIVAEALSDTRSQYQKVKDLHDHPNTEPHLKASAAKWLGSNTPAQKPTSSFNDRDFGKWDSKKSSNVDSYKKYHKATTDHNYSYKGPIPDTSGSAEEDHTVHHYSHMKGHKVELHMDPEQEHVDHWYHINKEHKATKGKGLDNLKTHLDSEYRKMWT